MNTLLSKNVVAKRNFLDWDEQPIKAGQFLGCLVMRGHSRDKGQFFNTILDNKVTSVIVGDFRKLLTFAGPLQ